MSWAPAASGHRATCRGTGIGYASLSVGTTDASASRKWNPHRASALHWARTVTASHAEGQRRKAPKFMHLPSSSERERIPNLHERQTAHGRCFVHIHITFSEGKGKRSTTEKLSVAWAAGPAAPGAGTGLRRWSHGFAMTANVRTTHTVLAAAARAGKRTLSGFPLRLEFNRGSL